MEFNEVLNRRYSCRAFAAQGVEQEKVDRILDSQPSAMHGARKSVGELVTRVC